MGEEAAVVGLPRNVEFQLYGDFYAARGLHRVEVEVWREETRVDPEYWTYRTYLNCDCNEYPYDGADGTKGGKYGPRSHHVGIVNHLFVDGSARGVRKHADVARYSYLITRDSW